MSFPIMIFVMLITGIIGGIINFLLPANQNTETNKKIRHWWECVILGIGATIMVPLFLQIAQSKLMDDSYFELKWQHCPDENCDTAKTSDTLLITVVKDSTQKVLKQDTVLKKITPDKQDAANAENKTNRPQNYLLFASYCLIAAAAGFRFINMLINNVVKEEQLTKLKEQNEVLEKQGEKRIKNAQMSQKKEAGKERTKITAIARGINSPDVLLPELPPVTDPNDPQKGRFGGKSENNFRRLTAQVTNSVFPDYYNVEICVESTDPANHPLDADVMFYIHDSFSPSVYTITTDEFTDGRACDKDILSYGAFTVGIITDNGKTLLELDLAENKAFPKEFRER